MRTSLSLGRVLVFAVMCGCGSSSPSSSPPADASSNDGGHSVFNNDGGTDSATNDASNPLSDASNPMSDASNPTGDAAADAAAAGNLGAACAQNSDCGGGGLTCTLPTANDPVFGGGPVNGYCSKTCLMDSDCPSNGACLLDAATGTHGTCVLTCTQGPALTSINNPINDTSKCLARADVACAQVGQTEFVCLPVCGDDSQCPSGLHCDPAATVCVMTPNTGIANGQPCVANSNTCAGLCLTIGLGGDAGTASICTSPCELGDPPATADTPSAWTACGGVTKGLCAYSTSTEGAGDQGFCTNSCLKQDDCDNPDFFCYAITNLTGTTGIPNGWCFGGTSCPNGNSDCTAHGFPGSTCVQTAYGPQCISAQFPLGSAAPDAGAPDGGGTDAGGTDAGDAGTD